MQTLEVSTVAHLPPEDVFEFLKDFPGYTEYSEYLERVDANGDGEEGTTYDIHFSWWKLTYTTRTEVTGTDAPDEIAWEVQKDIDAHGKWLVEECDLEGVEGEASEVTFLVNYDADSVTEDTIDLPMFVSLDWVVNKVEPLVVKEGQKVVERIVEDIEGEPREVSLDVEFHD